MIDAGGAAMRPRVEDDWFGPHVGPVGGRPAMNSSSRRKQVKVKAEAKPEAKPTPEATVRIQITETHDGEPCECVDDEKTLRVGDTIELTHVCHDGRVDKVLGKVVAIDTPPFQYPLEHGTATIRE